MHSPIPRARLERLHGLLAEKRKREDRKKQSGRGGLIHFVRHYWHVLEPETELVDGWALETICKHLEAVTFGEITRLLVNVPPGFMKSLLTDVFWPAWEWGPMDMPHLRYVAFSYSVGLTERDNGKFRDLLLSKAYQDLWGKAFTLRKVGEVKVTNDKTGSKLATSIGGIGTGERGDRAILDDPHNIKDGESEAIRNETVRWFRESLSNRLNDMEKSAIVVIMQRVHEGDISGTIINEMDYCHLMIQMEYDQSLFPYDYEGTQIGWVDPRKTDGELAWAERFSPDVVASLKRDLGPYAYAAQYQQAPVPRGGGILKSSWWQLWGKDEALAHGREWNEDKGGVKEFPTFDLVIASLDTAYTEKQENDASALTLWGLWRDRYGSRKLMLVYAWQERLELHALVERVALTCRKYKADRLLIEAKASGLSVAQEIRRLYGRERWGVEMINPKSMDKVARAHSIVPMFSEGMIVAPNTQWAQMVIDQCGSFPKGAHDDLVDSVSQAIRWLRDHGMAERNDEARGILDDAMAHRPRNIEPLYPTA